MSNICDINKGSKEYELDQYAFMEPTTMTTKRLSLLLVCVKENQLHYQANK